MRLIKLSTIDDKGQFNCNFNTDINLKPNSQIALKSCSFQPRLDGFNANAFNGQIELRYDSNLLNNFSPFIRTGLYEVGDERELMYKLNTALNRGLSIKNIVDRTQDTQLGLSQYLVYERDDKIHIELRATPLVNPNFNFTLRGSSFQYFITPPAPLNSVFSVETAGSTNSVVGVGNSNAATDTQKYRLTTPMGVGLSKGGGIFMAQINKSVVTGTPNSNGFGMGIAMHRQQQPNVLGGSTDPRSEVGIDNMPNRSRTCEIDFRDTNNNYRFITTGFGENTTGDGQFLDAGFSAHQTTEDDDGNDIIMFEIDNELNDQKVIRGSVIKLDGGGSFTKQVLFTQILTEREQNVFSRVTEADNVLEAEANETLGIDFVPYIYFRGNQDSIELTNIRVSLNPFILDTDYGVSGSNLFELENPILPDENDQAEIDTALELSVVGGNVDTNVGFIVDNDTESRLKISKELAEIFGFGNVNETDTPFDFSEEGDVDGFVIVRSLLKANKPSMFEAEQLYMIEIQSFDILSYNSGALNNYNVANRTTPIQFGRNFSGDRKNILDVILHNEQNHDTLIMHEPNNLNFIDIANTTTFNLRNLRLRIVNDDFLPVETFGVSHVVLLIKD